MKKITLISIIIVCLIAGGFFFVGKNSNSTAKLNFQVGKFEVALPESFSSLAKIDREDFDKKGCRINERTTLCGRADQNGESVFVQIESAVPMPKDHSSADKAGQEKLVKYIGDSIRAVYDDSALSIEETELHSAPAIVITTHDKELSIATYNVYFFIGTELYYYTFAATEDTYAKLFPDMKKAFDEAKVIN